MECNLIALDFKIESLLIRLFAVYRSPNDSNVNKFLEYLDNLLYQQVNNCDYYMLVGDVNIDIISCSSLYSQTYVNIMNKHGFKSYINIVTRQAGNTKSCIDHIFLKKSCNYFNPVVGNVFTTSISDHFSTTLHIAFERQINKCKNSNHTYKKIDFAFLKDLLKSESWDTVYGYKGDDLNILTELFVNKIKSCIDRSSSTISVSHKKRGLKPWMTNDLVTQINLRDKMNMKLKKEPFNSVLKNEYKTFRNNLTKLIAQTKANYYRSILDECKSDISKKWRVIKELIDAKPPNNDIKVGTVELNNYFCNVGRKCAELINKSKRDSESEHNLPPKAVLPINPHSLFLEPVIPSDIELIISHLNNTSSPGYDEISNKVLKHVSHSISNPFCFIINKCFKTGVFPKCFKIALIKPLFKSGDPTCPENYRPISLLSNLAKIMEKLIKSRLFDFVAKFGLLQSNQYGFQPNKSTEDALIEFTKTIINNMESNKKCLSIFLDLTKAFDTVPHEDLLSKLEAYGIRGVPLKLFENYLNDRSQILQLNSVSSKVNLTNFGLPQGTVLSPLLFLLYVNDMLLLKIPNCRAISFADDTALLFFGDTWNEVFSVAERGLGKVKFWLDANSLSLNLSKTKFITFSPNSTGQPPQNVSLKLHLNCSRSADCVCPSISKVKATKYLGLTVDENLRWDLHIKSICNKLKFVSYIFYRVKRVLELNELKIIYHALFQSIIEYGLIIWGGSYDSHIMPIFTLQKMVIKTILGKPLLFPSIDVFIDFQVLTLRQLYASKIVKYFNKNVNEFKKKNNAFHNLRLNSNDRYKILYPRLTILRRQFPFISIKLINRIPESILKSHNVKLVSRQLKDWIVCNIFFDLNFLEL